MQWFNATARWHYFAISFPQTRVLDFYFIFTFHTRCILLKDVEELLCGKNKQTNKWIACKKIASNLWIFLLHKITQMLNDVHTVYSPCLACFFFF